MQIELSTAPGPAEREAVLAPLRAHNQAMTGCTDTAVVLAVLLRDAEGAVEGGLWGTLWYGWFKLDYAYIPAHRRSARLGARMLASLEAAALARGATGCWMQSFSFQAPGFYEKLGYHRIGELQDRPPGHHDVFLAKTQGFVRDTPDQDVTENPTPEDRQTIRRLLVAYSDQFAGPADWRDLALLVRDDHGAIQGGLWGRTGRGWLFTELLGLPPALRGQGLGTTLIRRAEAEAGARGCVGAFLDTFSFQALPFYTALGYTKFAEIPDYPPGHTRFFLSRRLEHP